MKVRTEISAGGAVFRKIKSKIHILLIKDPKDNWTFPKGLIENGEDKISTAIREIKEEVGIDKIKFVGELGSVNYIYTFKEILVKKTVYYFLFAAQGKINPHPQKEEGIQEAKFIDLSKAYQIIGYTKTNEPVLKKISHFFKEKKAEKHVS